MKYNWNITKLDYNIKFNTLLLRALLHQPILQQLSQLLKFLQLQPLNRQLGSHRGKLPLDRKMSSCEKFSLAS